MGSIEKVFPITKSRTGQMSRTVTNKECRWLEADIPKGTLVFLFDGPTYGCVDFRSGIAVSLIEDGPFSQIPKDSVNWDSH